MKLHRTQIASVRSIAAAAAGIVITFAATPCLAEPLQFSVSRFIDARHLELTALQPGRCAEDLSVGDRFVVVSQSEGEPAGYAEVSEILEHEPSCKVSATPLLHDMSAMIMVGDLASREDLSTGSTLLPGRTPLQIFGNKNVSARYKSMAYFGPFIGDGQVLEQGEFLVDPIAYVQYGLSRRVTLETLAALDLVGVPNFGFKHRSFHEGDFTITTAALLAHDTAANDTYLQLRGTLTILGNGRFQSHNDIVYFFRPQRGIKDSLTDPELRVVNEYFLTSWNRLLFGPSYSFELKTVGGFLSYVMIWDHLHITLGLQTQDFTRLSMDRRAGYSPTFGIWWRL